ncbi:MAG: UDP-N-acetylglucosamine 2-epimerase (non-hydrolyzing) [Acidobacteria bacterium]|nr:UDP-N-acetylglucosamine 2-epimerase (non-hydrolyzing) [Acidobacteriota bacterium]
MKILTVFGTRPEAIKMAPIVKVLAQQYPEVKSVVCVTAQHRQMLDQVLGLFDISPDYDLNLMEPDQSLAALTSHALRRLDSVIGQEKPDWVLTQGDTTTAMAASLAAFYHRVKVGHVEAGLRTWDKYQPFPEEINRRIADAVAHLHFAPTEESRQNLLREGLPPLGIVVTGNTVIDALLDVAARPYDWEAGPIAAVPRDSRIVLVTAHRRENFGAPLHRICEALKDIAGQLPAVRIVYPVHLNPNVRQVVQAELGRTPNVTLLPPLDYLDLVHLMKASKLILTDSGGIQEEAPGLGKPVLVLREVTERPEGVAAGTVRLVGTDRQLIVSETLRLLEDSASYLQMANASNPYGDGEASQRIIRSIVNYSD